MLSHLRAILSRIAGATGLTEASLTRIGRETSDPFQVLVSCVLSLRTRDDTTDKASRRLFARARTPRGLLRLSAAQIEEAIYPVGFYRTKARTLLRICGLLLAEWGGKVPDSMEGLLSLPGVGRKTANIVLLYGFGRPALPIDTHCHRIPNRIGWVRTETPDETEEVLRKTLPSRYWSSFNNLFVRFGQEICKPLGPRCHECPIERFCEKRGLHAPAKKGKTSRQGPL